MSTQVLVSAVLFDDLPAFAKLIASVQIRKDFDLDEEAFIADDEGAFIADFARTHRLCFTADGRHLPGRPVLFSVDEEWVEELIERGLRPDDWKKTADAVRAELNTMTALVNDRIKTGLAAVNPKSARELGVSDIPTIPLSGLRNTELYPAGTLLYISCEEHGDDQFAHAATVTVNVVAKPTDMLARVLISNMPTFGAWVNSPTLTVTDKDIGLLPMFEYISEDGECIFAVDDYDLHDAPKLVGTSLGVLLHKNPYHFSTVVM